MYVQCRSLFDRLLSVAEQGDTRSAKKVFKVLIECSERRECPERATCQVDVNRAYVMNGMPPPFPKLMAKRAEV